jgi:transcriptional regulator with XRE-family HTH domain
MSVTSKGRLLAKLKNKAYRAAFVIEHVKTSVPLQIHALREQFGWTQGQLAERAKTTQTVISRLEDPNYGNLSLNSLLKLASAFDIGLLVKFVPFSRLLHEFQDLSPQALFAKPFVEELPTLEVWAKESTKEGSTVFKQGPSYAPTCKLFISGSMAASDTSKIPATKNNKVTTTDKSAHAGGPNSDIPFPILKDVI